MKSILYLAIAGLAYAAPSKRAEALPTLDTNILKLALTLEGIEWNLFTGAVKKFTPEEWTAAGVPASFAANVQQMADNELAHIQLINSTLASSGITGGAYCTYDFPYTTVKEFITLAQVVTSVGIGAYSGAIPLFMSPATEDASIAILPVESRHNAFLRVDGLEDSPFPADYDTALTANQSWTLAAPLIVSCPPTNPKLFVTPLPALAASPAMLSGSTAGMMVTFNTSSMPSNKTNCYAAWQQGINITFTSVNFTSSGFTAPVPAGYKGTTFVTLTSGNTAKNASAVEAATIAGPAAVVLNY